MALYAEITDLFRFGMPETARSFLTDDTLTAGLTAASEVANSYLRGRYSFPLVAWGQDLRMYTCWVANFLMLSGGRGYNAGAGADVNILERYTLAVDWFQGVQRKSIHPDITPSDGQSPTFDTPLVITSSVIDMNGTTARTRGW